VKEIKTKTDKENRHVVHAQYFILHPWGVFIGWLWSNWIIAPPGQQIAAYYRILFFCPTVGFAPALMVVICTIYRNGI